MRWRSVALVLFLPTGLAIWLGLQWLEHEASDQPYALIEENLYAGALVQTPPPGTNAVLNLAQQKDSFTVDVHRAMPIDGSAAPGID